MILIYMNTKEWGGVDVIVERFAAFLDERGIEFAIVEEEGSRLRERLPGAAFYSNSEVETLNGKVRHIFLPSVSKLHNQNLPLLLFKSANVFSWVVHPNDVFRGFFPLSGKLLDLVGYKAVPILRTLIPKHRRLFDAFFEAMVARDALSVMDGATARSLNYFVPSIAPDTLHVLPVPSPINQYATKQISQRYAAGGAVSIGYVGRMDTMKWSAIKSFVKSILVPLARLRKVAFHVVSEGGFTDELRSICIANNIEIFIYGYQPNQTARDIVSTKTDLAIAMGTSALDIAASRHPCIIIDPAVIPRASPQRLFRFVHEIEGFTLGEFRDFPHYETGIHDIESVLSGSELMGAAELGYDYVAANHDPAACFTSLLRRIQESALSAGEAHELITELTTSFARAKSNPLSWFN